MTDPTEPSEAEVSAQLDAARETWAAMQREEIYRIQILALRLARAHRAGVEQVLVLVDEFADAEDIRARTNRESGKVLHGNECEHAAVVLRRLAAQLRRAAAAKEG